MKLVTKIISFEVAKLLLTIIIVVFGVSGIHSIGTSLRAISNTNIPLMESISTITAAQIEQSLWLNQAMLKYELGGIAKANEASAKFGDSSDKVSVEIMDITEFLTEALKNEEDTTQKNKYKELLQQLSYISTSYDDYTENAIILLISLKQGNFAAVKKQLPVTEKHVENMSLGLNKLRMSISKLTLESTADAEKYESITTQTMWAISLIALALSVSLGIFITRNISRQLGCDPTELEKMAQSIADGQLAIKHDTEAAGVYGAISSTVERLVETINGIKVTAKKVGAASELVYRGNLDLSQRTQEQSENLDNVESSMDQMNDIIKKNEDNTKKANQMSISAHEIADNGKKIVDQTVDAISVIKNSNLKIADIMGFIEEIAFQTNLLALNAAVEAARAGEHGRGFAVVANEVKMLANRSSKSSIEIKKLINDNIETVSEGARLSGMSGSALVEIVEAINGVKNIVTEISNASKEQSSAIKQVSKDLQEMDKMTRQNASTTEQVTAASEAMGEDAHYLNALVSHFEVGDNALETLEPTAQIEKHSPYKN